MKLTLRVWRQPGPDATGGLFRNEILDEAGAGHDGSAKGSRERAHVGTVLPAILRSQQPHADFVYKHVWWWIDLDVQRTPQSDPDGSVFWFRLPIHHGRSMGFE